MDERILVSGGSGGIGAATCAALHERGLRPVVGYAGNRAEADDVARQCDGIVLHLDLTNDASIDRAVLALADGDGPLLGAVLAASPAPEIVPFGKTTPDAMRLQWTVNVMGPQRLLAGIVKSCFRPRKQGIVAGVLTHAMGTETDPPSSSMAAYVIAKYGLLGLLNTVASEYPWLTVLSVRPGYTETAMLQAFDPRFLDKARARAPFATAQDVAVSIVRKMFES